MVNAIAVYDSSDRAYTPLYKVGELISLLRLFTAQQEDVSFSKFMTGSDDLHTAYDELLSDKLLGALDSDDPDAAERKEDALQGVISLTEFCHDVLSRALGPLLRALQKSDNTD